MAARTRWLIAFLWLLLASLTVILRWYSLRPPDINTALGETLQIGVDASYPPFASFTTNGTLQGIDIDIGQAIGEHLNLPVEFVPMGTDGLYDTLQTGQVDILISALQPETWRMGYARYTRPYFDAGLVLVSEAHIAGMAALPGKSLAFEFGSSADGEIRRWTRRIPPFEQRPYELSIHALDAVRLGEADAALVDSVTLALYSNQYPDWNFETTPITHVHYVIAVFIQREDTFSLIDTTLSILMKQGIINTILEKRL